MSKKRIGAAVVVIAISILLIINGLAKNGFKQTLGKGSVICWECIGLGQD